MCFIFVVRGVDVYRFEDDPLLRRAGFPMVSTAVCFTVDARSLLDVAPPPSPGSRQ